MAIQQHRRPSAANLKEGQLTDHPRVASIARDGTDMSREMRITGPPHKSNRELQTRGFQNHLVEAARSFAWIACRTTSCSSGEFRDASLDGLKTDEIG
jgi:hypothetical protein